MRQVTAAEARQVFGALLDRVEQGEEIVITRYGKPVARLVPEIRPTDSRAAFEALARIRNRARTFRRDAFG